MPDDVLAAVDAEAARRNTTRSGLLRELAEESFRQRSNRRAARMAAIDAATPSVGHGGDVAGVVKSMRPGR